MKRLLRLAFLLMFLSIGLPRGLAQGGKPVFEHRYVPPPAETPIRQNIPEREPIPQGWIFAMEALLALVSAIWLIAAVRAWRASNVFERRYRFPSSGPAELRFGGNRSGGFMAVIEPTKGKKGA